MAELILASGSRFRREMLERAGVSLVVQAADVDEPALRRQLEAEDPDIEAGEVARALARAKAEQVSTMRPGALVIGADQVLVCGGEIFSKPAHVAAARDQLTSLRGLTHALPTAVCLATGGKTVWEHLDEPQLTTRSFSDAFLEQYLSTTGAGVAETVGGYKIEGLGAQLFESIEGDYFSIIGLPLMPLLAHLRRIGHLPT